MAYRVYKVTDMNNGSALVPRRFSAYTKYTTDSFVTPPFGLILAFDREVDALAFMHGQHGRFRLWEAVTRRPTQGVPVVAEVHYGDFHRWWLEGFWLSDQQVLIRNQQPPEGTIGCHDLKLVRCR